MDGSNVEESNPIGLYATERSFLFEKLQTTAHAYSTGATILEPYRFSSTFRPVAGATIPTPVTKPVGFSQPSFPDFFP